MMYSAVYRWNQTLYAASHLVSCGSKYTTSSLTHSVMRRHVSVTRCTSGRMEEDLSCQLRIQAETHRQQGHHWMRRYVDHSFRHSQLIRRDDVVAEAAAS